MEFVGRVEISGEVYDIVEFCMGAAGSPNVVVDIGEKELRNSAAICLE